VIGFAGNDALAGTLRGSVPFDVVRRFEDVPGAFESLVREGADLLVLDADDLTEADFGELRGALRVRPAGVLLFAHSAAREKVADGLRALGGVGVSKPIVYEDLATLAKLTRRSGAPLRPERLRGFAALLSTELQALGSEISRCAAEGSAAGVRASAAEILDLAERLDAIAGPLGTLPERKRDRVDLRDLLDRNLALLRESNPRSVPVTIQGERGIGVRAPAESMDRAVRDLLSFATDASGPEGAIEVRVARRPLRLEVIVSSPREDLGTVLAAGDPLRLDEAVQEDGNGLRLVLVSGVCESLGWSFSSERSVDGALRIEVRAPEAAAGGEGGR